MGVPASGPARLGELLVDAGAVQAAVRREADALRPRLAGRNALALAVMQGGMYYAVWLTLALAIPLEIDYVHLGRYGDGRRGGELRWLRRPQAALAGRTVLVIDDIFDEGATLEAIRAACREQGAREVIVAVLALKRHERAAGVRPDSVALEVPDRFVVGCGLDFAGRWRNLPAIYAVAEE